MWKPVLSAALVGTFLLTSALAQQSEDLRGGRGGDLSGSCPGPAWISLRSATSQFLSNVEHRFFKIPDTEVKFETEGPGCAIITFSAEVQFTDKLLIGVKVDDDFAYPGVVNFGEGGASRSDSRSFTFIAPHLQRGIHKVHVEARTNKCCLAMNYRMLIVQFPP